MSKPQAMMSLQFSRASLRASGIVMSLQHWHGLRAPTICQEMSLQPAASAPSISASRENIAGQLPSASALCMQLPAVQIVSQQHLLQGMLVPATRVTAAPGAARCTTTHFHRVFSSSVSWITRGTLKASCSHWVNMNGIKCPRCSASEDGPCRQDN